jgi:hypothetical protein
MYTNPHTHMAIARARHDDLLREADRRRQAAAFKSDRPGLFSRLREPLSQGEPRRVPAARPA